MDENPHTFERTPSKLAPGDLESSESESDGDLYTHQKLSRYEEWIKSGNLDDLKSVPQEEFEQVLQDSPALLLACRYGQLDIVQYLLSLNVDVNGDASSSPRSEESTKRQLEHIQKNADVNPLIVASRYGHEKVVKLLLEATASVDTFDQQQNTAISVAAESGNLDIVKLLLSCSADVTLKNKNGESPVDIANACSHFEIAKLIQSTHMKEFMDKCTYMGSIIKWKNTQNEVELMEVTKIVEDQCQGIYLNSTKKLSGNTFATLDFDNMVLTISPGFTFEEPFVFERDTRLYVDAAEYFGYPDSVYERRFEIEESDCDCIAQHGLDFYVSEEDKQCTLCARIQKKGYYMYGCRQCDYDVCTLCFTNTKKKNFEKFMFLGANKGHKALLEAMLEKSVNIGAVDSQGLTALHCASKSGQRHLIPTLIELQADVNQLDQHENTALHLAASAPRNAADCVRTLMMYLQDFFQQNAKGESVFDISAANTSNPLQLIDILSTEFAFPELRFISYDEIENIKLIESGGFGSVYRADLHIAETSDGPAYVAITCVCHVTRENPRSEANAWHQLHVLQNISPHQNISNLLCLCNGFYYNDTPQTASIFLLRKGGSLLRFLQQKDRADLTIKRMYKFGIDIARSVAHIHQYNFKHCDIAARNVLLCNEEPPSETHPLQRCLLTNFQLARHVQQRFDASYLLKLPLLWLAPETIKSGGTFTNHETDIWSLGVTLWELCAPAAGSYITPYSRRHSQQDSQGDTGHDDDSKTEKIDKSNILKCFEDGMKLDFEHVPSEWKDLIEKCCQLDPKARINANDLATRAEGYFSQVAAEEKCDNDSHAIGGVKAKDSVDLEKFQIHSLQRDVYILIRDPDIDYKSLQKEYDSCKEVNEKLQKQIEMLESTNNTPTKIPPLNIDTGSPVARSFRDPDDMAPTPKCKGGQCLLM